MGKGWSRVVGVAVGLFEGASLNSGLIRIYSHRRENKAIENPKEQERVAILVGQIKVTVWKWVEA